MPLMLPLFLHTLLYPHDSKDTSRDEEMGEEDVYEGRRTSCGISEWEREWDAMHECLVWEEKTRREERQTD